MKKKTYKKRSALVKPRPKKVAKPKATAEVKYVTKTYWSPTKGLIEERVAV